MAVAVVALLAFAPTGKLPAQDDAQTAVTVVVGKNAPPTERLAADELSQQWQKLFRAKVTIVTAPAKLANKQTDSSANQAVVYLGSPTTNSDIQKRFGQQWPRLSSQGIVIRSLASSRTDRSSKTLLIGGGSPAATLWAVYEFGYRQGIRSLLREDVYPAKTRELAFPKLDVVMEPQLKNRCWQTVNDLAIGPESWSLAEHKRVIAQLSKLKFNRLLLSVHPWQPFVHYQYQGIAKQTGVLWHGEKFSVARDAPGRTALGNATEFSNPEFAGATDYTSRSAAGRRYLQSIIAAAKRRGMSVGISISPLEFPREFAAVLPGARSAQGNNLLLQPGPQQKPQDSAIRELIKTRIRACLTSYPQVDAVYLRLPEFPQWDAHADDAWQLLKTRLGDGAPTLKQLEQAAHDRSLTARGDRGVRALRGNIVSLAALLPILQDEKLFGTTDRRRQIVLTAVDPELLPWMDRLVPQNIGGLHFIDYTSRRVVLNDNYLQKVPVASSMIMTLADDNVGVLSQSAVGRCEQILRSIHSLGWQGFSTRYWMLAELDPAVHYLSRAAWDPKLNARAAHDELFTSMTGKKAVADRLWLGFNHIEKATEIIDQMQPGFARPAADMIMKHYIAKPLPDWWEGMTKEYSDAMVELYRSHDAAEPRSRRQLFYWAKRSEYVLEYLAGVKALREAALAKKAGDSEKQIEHLETALEQIYNCIDTLSDVARDQGDRGLIAVLIRHAYAPVLAEYEKATEDE